MLNCSVYNKAEGFASILSIRCEAFSFYFYIVLLEELNAAFGGCVFVF